LSKADRKKFVLTRQILTPCSVHAIIRKAIQNERRRLEAAERAAQEQALSLPLASPSSPSPDTLGNLKLETHFF
jgi:hypothetical protein